MKEIIKKLDKRKRAVKESRYSTPGVMATEIMLSSTKGSGCDEKTRIEHLAAIKGVLKKT